MASRPPGFIPDAPKAARPPGFVPDGPGVAPGRVPFPVSTPFGRFNLTGEGVLNSLPAAGGAIGATGGPLGAALLGGAGYALKEAVAPALGLPGSKTLPELGGRIALAGGVEGAVSGAGSLMAKGAGRAGRYLMDRAIRPTPQLRQQFGDVTATALKERVGPGVGGGSGRIANKRVKSSIAEEVLADAVSKKANVAQLARRQIWQAEKKLKRPLTDKEKRGIMSAVRTRAQELLSQRTGGQVAERLRTRFTASEMRQLRQHARESAKTLKAARARGEASVSPDMDDAIERRARSLLNRNVPGMGDQTARTKELIGLERALKRAELPGETRTFAPIKVGWA